MKTPQLKLPCVSFCVKDCRGGMAVAEQSRAKWSNGAARSARGTPECLTRAWLPEGRRSEGNARIKKSDKNGGFCVVFRVVEKIERFQYNI